MSNYGLSEEVLGSIIDVGKRHGVGKIILFGSRARGDYKERSDIDLAVCGGRIEEFELDADEEVPTLLKFDVVNMDKPVQSELLCSINDEGVIIYEKQCGKRLVGIKYE
ncbi:MAG: nucleotidyltransferase domain-containing protein [Clostridiales bacterium]|nr:nucleotidyltransferase domain-containing protein [Clostridiales bacterium]